MNGDEILEDIMKKCKNEEIVQQIGYLLDFHFKGLDEEFNADNYKTGHNYDSSK